jgi:hypothetical protein
MLPAPLNEVLLSHAARGLPTEAELRERYAALVPQLVARAPRQGDMVQQAMSSMRGAAASVGLAAAPPPVGSGAGDRRASCSICAAATSPPRWATRQRSIRPPAAAGRLADAQAGARLAVEQAVQETLLRMLAAPTRAS